LVLTGPPGAGKTSVLTALSDTLSDADVPHAALEVEALRWTHPPLSLEEEMRHLRTVCGLLRDSGHRVLIIARTIEDDAEMAAVLRAIKSRHRQLPRRALGGPSGHAGGSDPRPRARELVGPGGPRLSRTGARCEHARPKRRRARLQHRRHAGRGRCRSDHRAMPRPTRLDRPALILGREPRRSKPRYAGLS